MEEEESGKRWITASRIQCNTVPVSRFGRLGQEGTLAHPAPNQSWKLATPLD